MGIGLGLGYLTPVKTLMLWFKNNKGLATGISIMGFGLAKAIATPVMELLQTTYSIETMFIVLGFVYFVMMFVGGLGGIKGRFKFIQAYYNVQEQDIRGHLAYVLSKYTLWFNAYYV